MKKNRPAFLAALLLGAEVFAQPPMGSRPEVTGQRGMVSADPRGRSYAIGH